MAACRGKVLATGIGKAGHVARKFTATLCSTATPAAFVHPGEAAHGDLGLIGPADLLVAFSTSGKSREVLEDAGAVPASRRRQGDWRHLPPGLGVAGTVGLGCWTWASLRSPAPWV